MNLEIVIIDNSSLSFVKMILLVLGALGLGGTIGMFAMGMASAAKVEPPPLARDIKMTVNPNKVTDDEETQGSDQNDKQ